MISLICAERLNFTVNFVSDMLAIFARICYDNINKLSVLALSKMHLSGRIFYEAVPVRLC